MIGLLPVLIIATSLAPALVTFFLPEERAGWRNGLNLGGAVLKLALVAFMLVEVADGAIYDTRFELAPGLALVLRVDALSLLFVTLSAVLWLLTTIYAIAYFEGARDLSRFFGFFSLCVAATTGVAFSGTLVTFFVFYEAPQRSRAWPLVVHKGDAARSPATGAPRLHDAGDAAALLARSSGIVLMSSGGETTPTKQSHSALGIRSASASTDVCASTSRFSSAGNNVRRSQGEALM